MEDHVTIWRVTTRFWDYGGVAQEAPMYFRSLDAAREHFDELQKRPREYSHSRIEELWVGSDFSETACAVLGREIEEEYVLKVLTLEVWKSPVQTPPGHSGP
jgi:hypothetical protein